MPSSSALPSICTTTMIIIILCSFTLIHGADTDLISSNQTLTGDQTIVSAGGIFRLGFFTPGKNKNSSRHYIGIWYNNISIETQTIVWVANRETPINNRFDYVLKVSHSNLVLVKIQDPSQFPVWSTNLNSTVSGLVKAVLQDNGNLVLRDGSNTNVTLWESFDYPAHSWLPGSKFGMNKKSGRIQVLTSWKNDEDPAPGLFSLMHDPNGTSQYFILRNGTDIYWTSGVWDNSIKRFTKVPEMFVLNRYKYNYVDNENESYFTFTTQEEWNVVTRSAMDVLGQFRINTLLNNSDQWTNIWSQPRGQCEVYALCGEFGVCIDDNLSACSCLQGFEPRSWSNWNLRDYSDGCARKTGLHCANNVSKLGQPRFLTQTKMRLPDHSRDISEVNTVSECEKRCLDSCSCTAYAYGESKCQIWDNGLLNLQQYDADRGDTLFIKLDASEFHNAKTKSNTATIIGIVVGALVLLVLGFLLFLIMRRQRETKVARLVDGTLVPFCYRDLQAATTNFSEKLGGGAFGSVYRGILADLTVIAVKKMEGVSQGEKQFRTEVSTIGTIQHLNLVRLRGFCSEGTKKLLVYDFMHNGSLDAHLFNNQTNILSWKTRYQIAVGIARGLHYLHEKCRDYIIHCDIKPENILLDADFCPKIADFGLAKLIGRDFSRVLTTMRGTRGYLAPEWLSGLAITPKADVYSYGMMLFELISGRRNFNQSQNRDHDLTKKFFPVYAANNIIKGDDVTELLDSRLNGNADIHEVIRACKVACWCVQDDETLRPSMGHIVQILEGMSEVNMPPFPRYLQLFADDLVEDSVVFFIEPSTTSTYHT